MTTYGVTPSGFVVKPLSAILASLTARLLSKVDPTTDVAPDQPLGQLLGVIAAELAEPWEALATAYNATNRADAEADLLDNIGGLVGTIREGARPSTVLCAVAFSAAGTYAAGALAAYVAGVPSQQWTNKQAITVPATGADGVNPIGANNTWPCPSGTGASLAITGSTVTLTDPAGHIPASAAGQTITIAGSSTPGNNGTFAGVTWISATSVSWQNASGAADTSAAVAWIVGSGTTYEFDSTVEGPTYGDALVAANTLAKAASPASLGYGQLSQRVPVAGWAAVADVTAPSIGALVETDTDYRVRQRKELSAPGSSTLDAIAAAILQALDAAPVPPEPFASVQMYENTSLVTDANGLPGKSFMAVVFDGEPFNRAQDDLLIAAAIWANKPGGMESFGTVPVSTPDSDGNLQTVYFARPTQVPINLTINVAVSASMTAPARAALVAAIAVALTNATQGQPYTLYGSTLVPAPGALTTFVPGQDVIVNALRSIVQGQPGVIDVTACTVTSPAPAADGNVAMGVTQLPALGVLTITPSTFVPGAP